MKADYGCHCVCNILYFWMHWFHYKQQVRQSARSASAFP